MSAFFERINAAKTGPSALAHRIALILSTRGLNAILVESQDDCFFYAALAERVRAAKRLEFFDAYNRKNTLDTLEVLSHLGKGDRTFGIIDRDFNFADDGILLSGRCFVLDVYSYENYFVEANLLVSVGRRAFGLELDSPWLARWETAVNSLLHVLENKFIREHAIALWCRRNKRKCNLQQFAIQRFVILNDAIELDVIEGFAKSFIEDTGLPADIHGASDQDIAEIESELIEKGYTYYFRGHYFWDMFIKLVASFRQLLISDATLHWRTRSRARVELSPRHLIESAVPFVSVPLELEGFILKAAGLEAPNTAG